MILLYDGSFEGFLSVIFECYAQKITPTDIRSDELFQDVFFDHKEFVPANSEQANRVWKAWQKKLSKNQHQLPFHAFLSNEQSIEMKLFHFAKTAFASNGLTESNFSDPDILVIRKAARRVSQEAMRMLQFIRFQLTKDNIYFAGIKPGYDVLPMILKHLQDRFADQQWIVYDIKRDYGFYYNLKTVEEITLNHKNFNLYDGSVSAHVLQEGEADYQNLWKDYCESITIKERLNLELQKQHMPKRYWKFLTEKK